MKDKIFPDGNKHNRKKQQPRVFLKGVTIIQCLGGILLILNIFLLYSIFFSSQGIPGFRQQYQQTREIQTKIRKLKVENQKLFNQIQGLKNDPQAQERLVREHLGWTREDELVVEFPQSKKDRAE